IYVKLDNNKKKCIQKNILKISPPRPKQTQPPPLKKFYRNKTTETPKKIFAVLKKPQKNVKQSRKGDKQSIKNNLRIPIHTNIFKKK
ncbi:hypothetical protein MMJ63_20790, partial [Bacillus vallismortis]|nr:hypothetical protein [Bacillus vallismortis]